jgi:uncharacterized delta-60 repeat protein
MALLAILVVPSASATPGDLDPTFGGRGWVVTRQFFHYDQEYQPKGAEDMARQADGKIVLTGEFLDSSSQWYFGAYRLTAGGDLDRSFGEGGWVDTQVGAFDLPHAVAIQHDGKILLAGESRCDDLIPCAVLIRHLPSGALDRSFGGTGVITLRTPRIDGAVDVAIQPDGKIVLLGWHFVSYRGGAYTLFSLLRVLPDGRLDWSFSKDGFARIGLRASQFPKALTLQRDGKIVVVGNGGTPRDESRYFEVARLRRDGRPGRTFSHDGIQIVAFRRREAGPTALAVQPNGRIVVVGTARVGVKPANERIAVVRLNRNGSLDRRFGKRLASPGPHGGSGNGVLIQPDGRILVAGAAYDDDWNSSSAWAVVRYLPNGHLDRAWGRSGTVIGDFGTGRDWASSMELQPDGKLLVAGSVYEDEAVARFFSH